MKKLLLLMAVILVFAALPVKSEVVFDTTHVELHVDTVRFQFLGWPNAVARLAVTTKNALVVDGQIIGVDRSQCSYNVIDRKTMNGALHLLSIERKYWRIKSHDTE